jgi:hypothetical protein
MKAPKDGGPLLPSEAIVVYNRRTGAIFSTHYFSVANGAKLPDSDELERVALDHAAKDGCDRRAHSMLRVDPAALKRGTAYRVVEGKLVEAQAAGPTPEPVARDESMDRDG